MEQTAINAVRMLAVDAINKAKSGHPGICLGAAPMLVDLYANFMNVDKTHMDWINRDRFILSGGHGVPMMYGLLNLMGFGVTVDDIKSLRQLHSKTPGHPEADVTAGIDASTGPLGQGIAMGVGFAMAERFLAAKFNREGFPVVDHYTYVMCGDGDLQEGIAQEAISLAGHHKLNKLVLLYDSNDVQLDGPTNASYTEDIKKKYEAMGWAYIRVENGNDTAAISKAIKRAHKNVDKPTLIEVKTVIGYGSPLAGLCDSHGAPLGEEKTAALRKTLGWDYAPFEVPEEAYQTMDVVNKRGKRAYSKWKKLVKAYTEQYPEEAKQFDNAVKGIYNLDFTLDFPVGHSDATRNTIGAVIKEFSKLNPTFIGGSADLTKSTKAKGADGDFTSDNPTGRNIMFGVREHAMGAIVNGLNIHGGVRAFTGAFFVFSDYMKGAMRLAALMGVPSIFVFTHDSIAVGEDGPTHEPIEQIAGLRATPNMDVYRPADAWEVVECFKKAIASKHTPSCIILTRQNLRVEDHANSDVAKGGYVLKEEQGKLDLCLLASGSEVNLAMNVANKLESQGKNVRVVSMPNTADFDKQSKAYRQSVLPDRKKVVAVEMSSDNVWYKYAAYVYGIDKFGASAPASVLMKEYGFTADQLADWIANNVK